MINILSIYHRFSVWYRYCREWHTARCSCLCVCASLLLFVPFHITCCKSIVIFCLTNKVNTLRNLLRKYSLYDVILNKSNETETKSFTLKRTSLFVWKNKTHNNHYNKIQTKNKLSFQSWNFLFFFIKCFIIIIVILFSLRKALFKNFTAVSEFF